MTERIFMVDFWVDEGAGKVLRQVRVRAADKTAARQRAKANLLAEHPGVRILDVGDALEITE